MSSDPPASPTQSCPRLPWASPEVVDQIVEIGKAESPREACGVISPDLRVVQLRNAHPTSPNDSYLIEIDDLVDSMVDYIHRSGVDPQLLTRSHFMVWHTHPSGNVGPSQGDIDHRIEGFQYLVVSLPGGQATVF